MLQLSLSAIENRYSRIVPAVGRYSAAYNWFDRSMRCAIQSRAGQVLANGSLFLETCDDGSLRLNLRTDGGRLLEGGIVSPDGDMTIASRELAEQFFEVWGMSDLTLTITLR